MKGSRPLARALPLWVGGLVLALAGPLAAQETPAEPPPEGTPAVQAEQVDPAQSEQAEEPAEADEATPVPGEDDEEGDSGQTAEPVPAEEPPTEEPAESEGPLQTPEVGSGNGEDEEQIQVDSLLPTSHRVRNVYQVSALYELHHNLISDEQSANDWYSYYLLRGDLNLTEHDQVSLRLDMTQQYVADPGESGLWFGDLRAYYSRMFTLTVADFDIPSKASIYLTAPTSRSSQERGYITKPTASLTLAPSWGPLTVIGQVLFQYAFARFNSSYTGDPNTQLTTGFSLELLYEVFDWFSPSLSWVTYWSLPYPTRENEGQSLQPEYALELALNFSVPMPEEAPTFDISLAYAQGAGTLEDGVTRFYFAKRNQSEIYLGLNFTY